MHPAFSAIAIALDHTWAYRARWLRACLWVVAIALAAGSGTPGVARGAFLLVAGQLSDNVVRFDIDTGAASLYATFPGFAAPREMAMDEPGQIYVSTFGGNRNVVKLVPQPGTDVLTAVDFTPNIGNFGPGQIQFHHGDLYAAGGRSRVIFQYDGQTGAEVRRFSVTTQFNIRGLLITGETLYYSETFQGRIRRMDLTQVPPTGGTLIQDPARLFEPISLAIRGDRLLITNRSSPFVREFDADTGSFIRTFVDLRDFDPPNLFAEQDKAITYYPELDNYFISAGDAVYRLSADGTLLQTYQSGLLASAYGVLVVPEPDTLGLLLVGLASFTCVTRRRWRRAIANPKIRVSAV